MNDYQDLLLPKIDEHERILKEYLIREARRCGLCVVRVVENIWGYCIQEADHDVRELIHLSHKYGSERLERACERALYYRQPSNSFTIWMILEKGYDRLVISPHTDCEGKFVFNFEPLTLANQNNVYSGLMSEYNPE